MTKQTGQSPRASLAAEQARARRFAVAAAQLAHDLHCEDVLVLDLRDRSPVTDYFLIATGTSDRQIRAVSDEIDKLARKGFGKAWHIAGQDSAQWIVLDFIDVVVHLFDAEHRRYYELELLWGDAPSIDWQR